MIGGTKGVFADYPPRIYIDGQPGGEEWGTLDQYKKDYESPLWAKEGAMASTLRWTWGHGLHHDLPLVAVHARRAAAGYGRVRRSSLVGAHSVKQDLCGAGQCAGQVSRFHAGLVEPAQRLFHLDVPHLWQCGFDESIKRSLRSGCARLEILEDSDFQTSGLLPILPQSRKRRPDLRDPAVSGGFKWASQI